MKLRVLVADDDLSIRSLLEEVLKDQGYEVVTAADGGEAWTKFAHQAFEVVLTDIRMPVLDGLDLLQRIRAKAPMTHVLMVTSHASVDSSVQALKEGAFDYLIKPFESLEQIATAVQRAADSITAMREREMLEATLKRRNKELGQLNKFFHDLAVRDGLTGLYNHRFVQDAMNTEFERAQKGQHPLAVIVIDVDHFKHYNDTHGHMHGDYLLRSLAELLREGVRDSDIVARWGGEEFVVICPGCTPEAAHELAERLCRTIAEHPFDGRDAQPGGCVSVSAGVAALTAQTPDPAALLRAADAAVYEVKRSGRNGVRLVA
jgi:diguanylate cyclase (GGDEF)-like protein